MLTKIVWGWKDWLDTHVDGWIVDGAIIIICCAVLYIAVNDAWHGK